MNFIDPEELPFTTEEIFRAASSFLTLEEARLTADHLRACAPALIEARAERRRGWLRAGVPDAHRLLLLGWTYPEDLLPALATLSPDVASRVEALKRRLLEDLDRAV